MTGSTPALCILVSLCASFAPASATDISGAGATFPYPIYAIWAESYEKETGKGVNYQPIGSTRGIEAITARTVTFGASDVPLTAKQIADGGNLVQWPMVMGGIVPVVNLDNVASNEMTLGGDTLAKIFLGEIRTWDHPALQALNPQLKLPSSAIVAVHRSDGSGTTHNFTSYLSKVSEPWKIKVGSGTSIDWPASIGAEGSEGVANIVQRTKGSIGYMDAAYAIQRKLTVTKMINKTGKAVEVTSATVQAAAAHSLIIADPPGATAWPISASSFIIMPAVVKDAGAAKEALKFFAWAYAHGDEAAKVLGYVPMPPSVKQLVIMQLWTEIKGPGGDSVYGPN
jgi:phosphate transport system substrate-binding protein